MHYLSTSLDIFLSMIKIEKNIFINYYEADLISSIDHILKRLTFMISVLQSQVKIN
jgi:hypothetical protein